MLSVVALLALVLVPLGHMAGGEIASALLAWLS